jgi:hypothetical protein
VLRRLALGALDSDLSRKVSDHAGGVGKALMRNSDVMMLMDMLKDAACNVLVGVIVLAGFAVLMTAILFCSLAVRHAWRWLTVATWRDVNLLVHRRALR